MRRERTEVKVREGRMTSPIRCRYTCNLLKGGPIQKSPGRAKRPHIKGSDITHTKRIIIGRLISLPNNLTYPPGDGSGRDGSVFIDSTARSRTSPPPPSHLFFRDTTLELEPYEIVNHDRPDQQSNAMKKSVQAQERMSGPGSYPGR